MLKDKDIKKLKELSREELSILARKLGMEKESESNIPLIRFFQNWYHHFLYQTRYSDIIENIMNNPSNKEIVTQFLDINFGLKALDENRLRQLSREFGIKETDPDNIIKNILNKGEIGELAEKLNRNRVFFVRRLILIVLACIIGYSILSFPEKVFDILSSDTPLKILFEVLAFIGIWLGGAASIIGFFLVFSPETTWKKRISACWTDNRLDLIVVLIFYIVYKHPDRGNLFGLMGALGSIFSVLLTLFYHKLEKWREKYFYKVYYGIAVMLFMGSIYISYFIIEGRVIYTDNNETVSGAIVKFVKNNDETDWWPCKGYKDEDSFIKFCGTKTNDKGNFFLRLIPFVTAREDFQLKATDGTHKSEPRPFSLGKRDIKISIKRKLLGGKWGCHLTEELLVWWDIEQKGNILIFSEEDKPKRPFKKVCFYNEPFSYSYDKKKFSLVPDQEASDKVKSSKIKIEIETVNEKKIKITYGNQNGNLLPFYCCKNSPCIDE